MINNKLKRYTPYIIIIVIYTVFGFLSYNDFFSDSAYRSNAGAILLKYGSRGATVKEVQARLRDWGYYDGSIDGIYGWRTRSAVVYFQRTHGLVADGIVGDATAAAIGVYEAPWTPTRGAVTRNNDIDLLARAVHGEARGESYVGKVAVAGCILNRVDDPRFPNTIAGVIYQPGAFTAVDDGQINLEPDDESRDAATDALNGWDPSGGALYYYNPAKTTSMWIYSRPVIKVIGRHYFAK